MESVIGLFKTECMRTTVLPAGTYRSLAEVEYATSGRVDMDNQRRLLGFLGMRSPTEYETAYYAALTLEPQSIQDRQRTCDASNSCPRKARTHVRPPGDSNFC